MKCNLYLGLIKKTNSLEFKKGKTGNQKVVDCKMRREKQLEIYNLQLSIIHIPILYCIYYNNIYIIIRDSAYQQYAAYNQCF